MKTSKLTKTDLNEIVGGLVLTPQSIDILNKNTISGCQCSYKNQNVIENTNSKVHCACVCV